MHPEIWKRVAAGRGTGRGGSDHGRRGGARVRGPPDRGGFAAEERG